MNNTSLSNPETFSGDPQVYRTQLWLNANFSNRSGYIPLDLSDNSPIKGKTGWTTINALIRAMQIELGIANTADNFGPTSEAYFKRDYPKGILQQTDNAATESNVYGILQGALWCKGYK